MFRSSFEPGLEMRGTQSHLAKLAGPSQAESVTESVAESKMALAAIWGTPAHGGPEGGETVGCAQHGSGCSQGHFWAPRHREEITVLLSANLLIKILIRSLAISGFQHVLRKIGGIWEISKMF